MSISNQSATSSRSTEGAKGRKLSSTLWLERQLNDPYVIRAKKEGYRGRAAYKISELDDKYGFLKPGARVVDLGHVRRAVALTEYARAGLAWVFGAAPNWIELPLKILELVVS